MNTYSTSLDRLSVIITWGVAALALFIMASGYYTYLRVGSRAAVLLSAGTGPVIILLLMIWMYLLQPRKLVVGDSGIVIDRRIQPVTLPYTNMVGVRVAEQYELAGTLRTFGNGGLFGYTGWFYNSRLGSMKWYCTQRSNYVIIDRKEGKRIVLSPDNPEAFVKTVTAMQPQLAISL